MDPVEVPKDLHFDAAKIIRLAKMQEEEEKEREPVPVSFLDRLRESFQSRRWTRYAAAAAAFVVLLGVYGMTRGGSDVPPGPGTDPGQVAVIDDPTEPLTPPDEPVQEDPVQTDDPVVTDVPEDGQQTEEPPETVTPAQPTQSAQNPPKPQQPKPKPPVEQQPQQTEETDPEEIVEDPAVEEETDEVDNPTEYAGGKEIDPDEEPQDPPEGQGEEPAGPEEPGDEPVEPGEEGDDPEENIWENQLQQAMQDEAFAEQYNAEDKGFGHSIRSVEDVPDGTEFMVYFYENEEEAASGTINEDDIRSILWKKESL